MQKKGTITLTDICVYTHGRFYSYLTTQKSSPGGSAVKVCLPMQEMWVQSLDWEDLLEEEMATPSGILAWEIPWTEGPGGLQSMGSQRIGHDLPTKQHHQPHLLVHSLLCLLKGLCVPFKNHWCLILRPLDFDVVSLQSTWMLEFFF